MPGIPAAPKSADVEVQVFHYGVGRAEEPAEERPHIGMEWHVEKGVRHIADSHEVVSGEEPTDLLEGSEGEPKACHICGRIEAGASVDGAARDGVGREDAHTQLPRPGEPRPLTAARARPWHRSGWG